MAATNITSEYLHLTIVAYLRLCLPNLRWRHVPNGERRDKRTAAKLKTMGVEPGVADLHIPMPDGRTRWVELKATGGWRASWPNGRSPTQGAQNDYYCKKAHSSGL